MPRRNKRRHGAAQEAARDSELQHACAPLAIAPRTQRAEVQTGAACLRDLFAVVDLTMTLEMGSVAEHAFELKKRSADSQCFTYVQQTHENRTAFASLYSSLTSKTCVEDRLPFWVCTYLDTTACGFQGADKSASPREMQSDLAIFIFEKLWSNEPSSHALEHLVKFINPATLLPWK